MNNTQREWEGQADLIQQYFFERGAQVDRAAFDFVLAEITKARAEGAAAERDSIGRLINSTENDMRKLELVVDYLNTPTKDKGEDVSSNNTV